MAFYSLGFFHLGLSFDIVVNDHFPLASSNHHNLLCRPSTTLTIGLEKNSVGLFHSLSSNLEPSLLNMIDLAFEVEPPSPDSDDARLHVIDYVRLPAMLELFEEKAGFSLGSSILDTFLPAPMPLDSHKTVIDHAKFIMDTWGKSTILVRAPVGNKLSNIVQDHKIVKLRYEDIRRRMKVCCTQSPVVM